MSDYSYIGVGKVYMRVFGADAGLLPVGNVSALSLAISEETKELKDFTQAGGGTYNEVRRVESVEVSLTIHDLSPDNLAKAVFGDASAIAAGTVTDEVQTAYVGALVPTNYPINTASPVVVTNTAGSTTYTADTDFVLTDHGITIPLTGSAIVDSQDIKIDYTKKAGNSVEALLNSAQEYELVFAGLNEARSGKAVTVKLHRVKLGAAADLALIGEDYAGLELSGKVLKDTTKNGTSVSQYFKVDIVE